MYESDYTARQTTLSIDKRKCCFAIKTKSSLSIHSLFLWTKEKRALLKEAVQLLLKKTKFEWEITKKTYARTHSNIYGGAFNFQN